MVFTSNVFVFLYLPLFLLCYYGLPERWRSHVIVAGSYLFYAWWRPDFLLLFVGITYWNYQFGKHIHACLDHAPQKAWRLLVVGVVGNLLTLGYFKYANFGVEVIANALKPLGIETFTLEHIILPLGISFYVFQALSYIVDIYRREAEPAKNFTDFAAFVALFPQLIAGPILRYSLIDQQLKQRTHSWALFSLGCCRFMLGFVKKVLIADSIAPLSNAFLAHPELPFVDAWFGVFASLMQLYFDFSGYSDMAIGLGMIMGFRFAENFNQPFMCMSLTEFWRRWHLTLADFLKDYVYVPLAKAGVNGSTALFLTMLLSGFWHGASFAFICFGLFFAIIMVIERKFGWATHLGTPYQLHRNLIAMTLVLCIMPMFITGNLAHSIDIYTGMFGFRSLGSLDYYILSTSKMTLAFVVLGFIWIVIAGMINRRFYAQHATQKKAAAPTQTSELTYFMQSVRGTGAVFLWMGFGVAVTRLAANSFSPFLYFQF
ncbi:MAG: MBOAT family protein [Hahellaceae bacterium]|nr:MBOAT family protein [Hahellaceae bacterium]MCP5169117.1 MBOAT family protein [Hahellaceae bacterium]